MQIQIDQNNFLKSHMSRLVKFTLGRDASKFFLILGDLGGAAFIGWSVRNFLPSLPNSNHILQIWLLSIAVFWLFTYDIDKNFRIDFFLTYTRILKTACFAAISYLLFFVITRSFYSLTFLLWVTSLWIIWAGSLRWLLGKFSPPMRGLAFETLPNTLHNNKKVIWTLVTDSKKINLTDFDFLAMDFSKRYSTDCQNLLTHAHVVGLPLLSLPQIVEHLTGKISIEHFNDFWVETTFYIDPIYLKLKRLFDIVFTIFLLPILIPLALIIACLILILMGRPILYWQDRIGLDDKIFRIVKFRTMVIDAERVGTGSTLKNDSRVTRLGILLRKLRLDELPQFYNVLKGDMSIIGPRPEYAVLVENFVKNIPLFQVRHWLRPGITGWAQVMHGYATSEDEMMEKIRYDMFYLKNLSLWLDLIILFRTVVTVLTGFGSR